MTQLTRPVLLPSQDNRTAGLRLPNLDHPHIHRAAIIVLMLLSAALLFSLSALRHNVFRSGALDLGFFDQLVYLISQGKQPISSILGYHALGDHGAFNLYLVAPFYWIYPSAYTLLVVQAIALASGAYPIWRMARLAGASETKSLAAALAYLLYPIVLTAAIFDFHPEVFTVPAILFAVLFAREKRMFAFIIALIIACGGKEIIGLTVAALGFYLIVGEKKYSFGVVAMAIGAGWFVFASKWLIPHFGYGKPPSGMQFFSYLGTSVGEIAKNVFLHPASWMSQVFTFRVLKYLAILFVPVIWGLKPRYMLPLMCALPTMAMNILARGDEGMDLTTPNGQYSLMVVPFIALSLIAALAANNAWINRPKLIAAWSILLVLGGVGLRLRGMNHYQASDYENQLAAREAIAHVRGTGSVLTTHEIVPHLSQRDTVQYFSTEPLIKPLSPVNEYDYVLFNLADDSSKTAGSQVMTMFEQAKADPAFQLIYQREWVYLFHRSGAPGEASQANVR